MSKDQWLAAHEQAVNEAMDANEGLTWTQAYESDAVARRADEIYRDRAAALIDYYREKAKYEHTPKD